MSLFRLFVLFEFTLPTLLWHGFGFTNRQPNRSRVFALVKALLPGSVCQRLKHQISEQDTGIGCAKLMVHEFVKLTQAHRLLLCAGCPIGRTDKKGVEFVDVDGVLARSQ